MTLTGIPYGLFKICGGFALAEDVHPAAGWLFIVWGVLDILWNVAAAVLPGVFSYCTLSNLGRALDRQRPIATFEPLLLAFDTLLSFGIVATMIGFGRIASLPTPMVGIWELAVIANVLGVGVERVWTSWPRDRADAQQNQRRRTVPTQPDEVA
ncbi:MAG: hypothetical protein ACOYOB_07410 [Myxococcota bacterium]